MNSNIILYSVFFYLVGIIGNLLIIHSIPEEYFDQSGASKDIGYTVSIVLPYSILLTAIYYFLVGLIEQIKFRVKIWYFRWKLKRIIGKINKRDDLDMDEIIEQIDNISKKEE